MGLFGFSKFVEILTFLDVLDGFPQFSKLAIIRVRSRLNPLFLVCCLNHILLRLIDQSTSAVTAVLALTDSLDQARITAVAVLPSIVLPHQLELTIFHKEFVEDVISFGRALLAFIWSSV